MSNIAHLLFQGLDLHSGCTRNRLRNFDATTFADSVGIDSQSDGEENARGERQPHILPIDLRAPMTVSVSEDKTSFADTSHLACFVHVRREWRGRVGRSRSL